MLVFFFNNAGLFRKKILLSFFSLYQALAQLKSKCDQYERTIQEQESSLKEATQNAGTARSTLQTLQSDLNRITEDLAQLYHLVCQVTGDTPSRVMLDHAKGEAVHRDSERESSEEPSPQASSPSDENKPVIVNGKVRRLSRLRQVIALSQVECFLMKYSNTEKI